MFKVIIYASLCVIAANADGDQIASYGGNDGGYGGGNSYGNDYTNYKPMPYSFGYASKDKYGTELGRQEAGDESGAVKGTYSYINDKGLYRKVEYIADKDGFRVIVNTNEPGVEKSRPADAVINGPEVAYAADNYKKYNDDYNNNNYKRDDDNKKSY